jgi:hypothetical protein
VHKGHMLAVCAALLLSHMLAALAALSLAGASEGGCDDRPTSDDVQRQQQERMFREGTSQVGMPAILNFRERKLLKEIYEMRDQSSFITYSYLWNEFNGKFVFLCQSVGYPIPYSTRFTNPQKAIGDNYHALTTIAQADPNGLFSPAAADGTWVLCKDPKGDALRPVYVEPRVVGSPFRLGE